MPSVQKNIWTIGVTETKKFLLNSDDLSGTFFRSLLTWQPIPRSISSCNRDIVVLWRAISLLYSIQFGSNSCLYLFTTESYSLCLLQTVAPEHVRLLCKYRGERLPSENANMGGLSICWVWTCVLLHANGQQRTTLKTGSNATARPRVTR